MYSAKVWTIWGNNECDRTQEEASSTNQGCWIYNLRTYYLNITKNAYYTYNDSQTWVTQYMYIGNTRIHGFWKLIRYIYMFKKKRNLHKGTLSAVIKLI